jgi:hypothetical protein
MTTERQLVINIETELGNKLYWFLKFLMRDYPDIIMEKKEERVG